MPRPIWSGAITFGLVTVPVRLFPAVRRHSVSFHQINAETGNRVRRQRVDGQTGAEVDRDQIVKGYDLGDGRHVVVERDELDQLAPEASRSIVIEDFVPVTQLDVLHLDRPYWLGPDGDAATRPYRLLVEALARTEHVGIARFVMRGSEHLAAVRAHAGALVLTTLNRDDEVLAPDEALDGMDGLEDPDDRELEMAVQLVEAMSTDFDPGAYPDEHHERVADLLRRKADGEAIEVTEEAEDDGGDVLDLMAALEASLEGRGSAGAGRDLGDMTRDELYDLAQQRDLPGRSGMTKAELVAALSRDDLRDAG